MIKKIKKTKSPAKNKQNSAGLAKLLPLPRRERITEMKISAFGDSKATEADQAQAIMYDAWDAPARQQAVALARKALSISPDCADAYVLLAQETANSLDEEIQLYLRGVQAGEKALGKKTFKEDAGYFWGLLETRPYMRARAGLAECLWLAGQREEAVEHWKDMLRLNPNDNQGIRYILLPHLIELGSDDAGTLYEQYRDDGSAFWVYSKALLDFRAQGDSPSVNKSLAQALLRNRHVPAYLLGRKKMPRSLPDYYGLGDQNEAVVYTDGCKAAWDATPGALDWLAGNVK